METDDRQYPLLRSCRLLPGRAYRPRRIGLPFEGKALNLAAGEQRSAQYLAINDRGRVPALVEDGWVLTECAAIMRHAARQVPDKGLWPTDLREQAEADEWLGWLACNHHVTYAHVRRVERYTDDDTHPPSTGSAPRQRTPTATSAR